MIEKARRFYRGPNIFHPGSGLLVDLHEIKDDFESQVNLATSAKIKIREICDFLGIDFADRSSAAFLGKSTVDVFIFISSLVNKSLHFPCSTPFVIYKRAKSARVFFPGEHKQILEWVFSIVHSVFDDQGTTSDTPPDYSSKVISDSPLRVAGSTETFLDLLALDNAAKKMNLPSQIVWSSKPAIHIGEGCRSVGIMGRVSHSSAATSLLSDTAIQHQLRSQGVTIWQDQSRTNPTKWQSIDITDSQIFLEVSKSTVSALQFGPFKSRQDGEAWIKALAEKNDDLDVMAFPVGSKVSLLVINGVIICGLQRRQHSLTSEQVLQLISGISSAENPETEGSLKVPCAVPRDIPRMIRAQYLAVAQSLDFSACSRIDPPGIRLGASGKERYIDVTKALSEGYQTLASKCHQISKHNLLQLDLVVTNRNAEELILVDILTAPDLTPFLAYEINQNTSKTILKISTPKRSLGAIPKVLVTGSYGKTTTAKMIEAALLRLGRNVACATTQGSWINGQQVLSEDSAGGSAALSLLRDRQADVGVFEMAHGGLLYEGLGINECEVGILLNIRDNHVGTGTIRSIRQIQFAKSLVVKHARDLAILNASDHHCMEILPQLSARKIALVASSAQEQVRAHAQRKGIAGWLDGDTLYIWSNGMLEVSHSFSSLHVSLGGMFREVAVNVLSAAITLIHLGTPPGHVFKLLNEFSSNETENPGRNNIKRGQPFTLFESHADGPFALSAIIPSALAMATGHKRALLTAAGDRSDSFIRQAAVVVAGNFNDYFLTDWIELRGRQPGEVPKILRQGLLDAGVPDDHIKIFSPAEAVRRAKFNLREEDLLFSVLYPMKIPE